MLGLVLYVTNKWILIAANGTIVHLNRFDELNHAAAHVIHGCDDSLDFPWFHALTLNFDLIVAPTAKQTILRKM